MNCQYLVVRFLALTTLFILSSFAWADGPDLISSFNSARREVGGSIDSMVNGSCQQQILEADGLECGSPQFTDSMNKLTQDMQSIDMRARENAFFEKAQADQYSVISCEIQQLRYVNEFGDGMIEDAMEDICHKLPELKVRRRAIDGLKRRATQLTLRLRASEEARSNSMTGSTFTEKLKHAAIDSVQNLFLGPVGKIIADKVMTLNPQDEALLRAEAGKVSAKLKEEVEKYNVIKGSTWRFSDPKMEDYLEGQVAAATPEEACLGSVTSSTAGATPDQIKNGWAIREKFRNNTLLPMIGDLQGNLSSIKVLSPRGMEILLERSDMGQALNTSAEKGNIQDKLLMCQMVSQIRGDGYAQTTLEAATLLTGGMGMFLKFARVLNALKALNVQKVLNASNVMLMMSGATSAPLTAMQVQDACFGGVPTSTYQLKGASCPTGNAILDVQRQAVEKENCALSIALGAAEVVPGTLGWVERFKGSRRVFGAVEDASVSAARATQVKRAERLAELENPGEDIVVTATRRPKSVESPESLARKARAQERAALEVESDQQLLTQELRGNLRGFSNTVDQDYADILAGKSSEVLARYPDLNPEEIKKIKSLESALSRNQIKASSVKSRGEARAEAVASSHNLSVAEMVKRNYAIADDQVRKDLIRKDFPNLNQTQIDAIVDEVHAIGKATRESGLDYTPAEIAQKARRLKELGVADEDSAALLRLGYAGSDTGRVLDRVDGIRAVEASKKTQYQINQLVVRGDPPNHELMASYKQQVSEAGDSFSQQALRDLQAGDRANSVQHTALALRQYVRSGNLQSAQQTINIGLEKGMTREGIIKQVSREVEERFRANPNDPTLKLEKATWDKVVAGLRVETPKPQAPVVKVAEVRAPAEVPKVAEPVPTWSPAKSVSEAKTRANEMRLKGKPEEASRYYFQAAQENLEREAKRKKMDSVTKYMDDREISNAFMESFRGSGEIASQVVEKIYKTGGSREVNGFLHELHQQNYYQWFKKDVPENALARKNFVKWAEEMELKHKKAGELYTPQENYLRDFRRSNDW